MNMSETPRYPFNNPDVIDKNFKNNREEQDKWPRALHGDSVRPEFDHLVDEDELKAVQDSDKVAVEGELQTEEKDTSDDKKEEGPVEKIDRLSRGEVIDQP